jgi:hypothetical protein
MALMLINFPYHERGKARIVYFFNEFMTSAYLYALIGLTEYNLEVRDSIGLVLFGIVVSSLGFNILIMLYGFLDPWMCRQAIRLHRYCFMDDKNFANINIKSAKKVQTKKTVKFKP